jgi:hypothetical protein
MTNASGRERPEALITRLKSFIKKALIQNNLKALLSQIIVCK